VTLSPDCQGLVRERLREIPDFPKPGVVFKDINPLLGDPVAFRAVIDALAAHGREVGATRVAGVEARGFLLASALAYALDIGVVPIRKAGKLPGDTLTAQYDLEYGTATLEVAKDAFASGDRVLLIDDVLATGGTAAAAASLVQLAGGEPLGLSVLLELTFLGGRGRVAPLPVHALLAD
jgi:adenine phosphoribosyltransferase